MRQLLSKMDTQTLVLDLAQPITHAPLLPNFATRRVDEHTLEVVVSGNTSISDLFTALAAQNIAVSSLRNKTNRLEELFIQLVGDKEAA
jgi:ABC-2 type transport system ATP-binding protein